MKSLLKAAFFSLIFAQTIFITPPPVETDATVEASSLLACGCGRKH